ncbi:MAG: HU family DNA-binding protein [Polyangia bacterium]|jgi:integration host factor subunit beta
MTKADLIAVVADKLKFPWARAELLVDQIFACMAQALAQGDGIEIRGFGSFTVRSYKAYEGRNPRTGDMVHVKPKRLAFFKVGKELRERVNKGRARAAAQKLAGPTVPSSPALAARSLTHGRA